MSTTKKWACIASIKALLARDDLTPDQRQAAEFVLSNLKKLARVKKPGQREVARCVGEVAEHLIRAFAKPKQ